MRGTWPGDRDGEVISSGWRSRDPAVTRGDPLGVCGSSFLLFEWQECSGSFTYVHPHQVTRRVNIIIGAVFQMRKPRRRELESPPDAPRDRGHFTSVPRPLPLSQGWYQRPRGPGHSALGMLCVQGRAWGRVDTGEWSFTPGALPGGFQGLVQRRGVGLALWIRESRERSPSPLGDHRRNQGASLRPTGGRWRQERWGVYGGGGSRSREEEPHG